MSRPVDAASGPPRESPAGSVDAEIRAALARGDRRSALERAMDAYGDALYRYCAEVVRDDALAEDVHQMVFVQAYNDLDDFGGLSSVRSWLYGIARHRCLDAIKHRRRWGRRFSLSGDVTEPADESRPVDERLATRSMADVLRSCLGKLAPHARSAVLLRYQEELAYEEMGRICRERAPTLQARVARALPVLRRCLEQHGVKP